MKKIIVLAIVAMGLASCGPKNGYTISGTVTDTIIDGKSVYMYLGSKIIDSTGVQDGEFQFTGVADSVNIVEITYDTQAWTTYGAVAIEPGDIELTLTPKQHTTAATGTLLNDAQSNYTIARNNLELELRSKYEQTTADTTITPEQTKMQIAAINKTYFEQTKQTALQSISENRNNELGALLLANHYSRDFTDNQFDSIYNTMGHKAQNFYKLKHIYNIYEHKTRTNEGKQYVNFTIEDGSIDGTKAALSDYAGKGKIVLVDFWASWCGPCIKEIPNLKKIHEKYADKVTVLSVAISDKRNATIRAINQNNLNWAHILDTQGVAAKIYGISTIPHIMLINQDGIIIARGIRGQEIEETINATLNQN